MTDAAWPRPAGAEPNEFGSATAPSSHPDRVRSTWVPVDGSHEPHEAIVDGLTFEPFLHFQFRCEPPLHVEIASNSRSPLYIVGSHGCYLRWEDHPPRALGAGDVVFLPHAGRHRIYTDEQAPRRQFSDLVSHGLRRRGKSFDVVVGQGGAAPRAAEARWTGSFYWRSDLAAHPLMASLPPVLVLAETAATTWLPAMTRLVDWMADIRGGGNGIGLTHVMNSLLQRLVLAWLTEPAHASRAPVRDASAPRDERLLPALQSIHTQCGHPWTATSLAALCHMSRTQFTQRFQAQMGLPPMRYLARWRLHLADRMLNEQRMTLQQVADAVGYSTGAILARAYKRERGVSPTFQQKGG